MAVSSAAILTLTDVSLPPRATLTTGTAYGAAAEATSRAAETARTVGERAYESVSGVPTAAAEMAGRAAGMDLTPSALKGGREGGEERWGCFV